MPPPLRNPKKGDRFKYCTYHSAQGHDLEKYFKWRDYPEKLTNEGTFTKFVATEANKLKEKTRESSTSKGNLNQNHIDEV